MQIEHSSRGLAWEVPVTGIVPVVPSVALPVVLFVALPCVRCVRRSVTIARRTERSTTAEGRHTLVRGATLVSPSQFEVVTVLSRASLRLVSVMFDDEVLGDATKLCLPDS